MEVESTDAPEVEDEARYEAELRRELEHSYERLNVPGDKRRREGSQLRDSSVELAGPLDPEVDDGLADRDSGSEELDLDRQGDLDRELSDGETQ